MNPLQVRTDVTILAPNGEPYVPTPQQQHFHDCPVRHRAFLGARGTGKTLAGAIEAVKTALLFPGSEGLVARATWKELAVATWPVLRGIVPAALVRRERDTIDQPRLELTNGSCIFGLSLGRERWNVLRACNCDWAWLDEPDEMEAAAGHLLPYRLRDSVGPHRIWVTGQPQSGGWTVPMFDYGGELFVDIPSDIDIPSGIEVAAG